MFGTAVVSLDMKSAFDTLNCDLAVEKFREAGFPIGFVHWLANYFQGRTGQIRIKGQCSIDFPLSRGVPQGSVLGPLFSASIFEMSLVPVLIPPPSSTPTTLIW